MANIQDVARKAGVSTATVSRVINNSGYVGDETRQRVYEAMAALNYTPNSLARSLRTKATLIVALVIPDVMNPFFPSLVRGVDDTVTQAGYRLLLCNSDGNPQKELSILNVLLEKRVDGVVFTPTGESKEALEFVQSNQLPVVLLDRIVDSSSVDCITTDHYVGALRAVQHLINLGHRNIGHITGPRGVYSAEERIRGYRDALQQAGIPVDEALMVHGDFTRYAGWSGLDAFLKNRKRVTAIFASNDLSAVGVMERARDLGLRVPEEVSVCGFDDIDYATVVTPRLSTVAQPKYKLGQLAAQLLLRRIQEPGSEVRHIKLAPDLIVRESTARPMAVQGN